MYPTKYGRSRFIGTEPFTAPPPNLSADGANARLAEAREASFDFIREHMWTPWIDREDNKLTEAEIELTQEDLRLMAAIECRKAADVPTFLRDSRTSKLNSRSDWQHFLIEDTNQYSAWTEGLLKKMREDGTYDERVPAGSGISAQYWVFGEVRDRYMDFYFPDEFGPAELWLIKSLKSAFQRPRPFQVAPFSDLFYVYPTESGHHPALPAGHTLQPVLRALNWSLAEKSKALWSDSVEDLANWAASVSDRRVFTGLHYPSDTIAGYLCALQLAEVFWPKYENRSKFVTDILKRTAPVKLIEKGADKYPRLNKLLQQLLREF